MAGEFEERAECWTRGKDLAQTIEAVGFEAAHLSGSWVHAIGDSRTWNRLDQELVPQVRNQLLASKDCGVGPDTLKELTTTLGEIQDAVSNEDIPHLITYTGRFRRTLAGAIP